MKLCCFKMIRLRVICYSAIYSNQDRVLGTGKKEDKIGIKSAHVVSSKPY